MPGTWKEWSVQIGATSIFNPVDNARTGARYLAWLLERVGGNRYNALVAYNFGIGNLENGVKPPIDTVIYARKILHGRDLLVAVGV
jgi:soluble lytic murein transglycosylase-like protein